MFMRVGCGQLGAAKERFAVDEGTGQMGPRSGSHYGQAAQSAYESSGQRMYACLCPLNIKKAFISQCIYTRPEMGMSSLASCTGEKCHTNIILSCSAQ